MKQTKNAAIVVIAVLFISTITMSVYAMKLREDKVVLEDKIRDLLNRELEVIIGVTWNVTIQGEEMVSLEIPELVEPVMVYYVAEDWADEIYEALSVMESHRYPSELVGGWHNPPDGVNTVIVIDTQERALAIANDVGLNDAVWYCISDATTVVKITD